VWEEHILAVFGNGALRRTYGPRRDKVIEGWRKSHSEELHNLFSSSNIIMVFIDIKGQNKAGRG
jgi:hypothetical protein